MYLAETPYQLLAALCLATDSKNSLASKDIILTSAINDFEAIGKRLEKCAVFDNIWTFDSSVFPAVSPGLSLCKQLLTSPNKANSLFKRSFTGNAPLFAAPGYSTFVCASATWTTILAKHILAPQAQTWLLEDGSGTYNGMIGRSLMMYDIILSKHDFSVKGILKFLFNLVTRGKYKLKVTSVFVFSPSNIPFDLYRKDLVKGVLNLTHQAQCIGLSVFAVPANRKTETENPAIFLGQPNEIGPSFPELQHECIRTFTSAVGNSAVLRPHPRSSLQPISAEKNLELATTSSWELLVAIGRVTEDAILVGFGSTAQLTPKKLFDIEPRLLYLFPLLPDSNPSKKAFEAEYEAALTIYNQKDRVLAIHSLKELSETLSALTKKPATR